MLPTIIKLSVTDLLEYAFLMVLGHISGMSRTVSNWLLIKWFDFKCAKIYIQEVPYLFNICLYRILRQFPTQNCSLFSFIPILRPFNLAPRFLQVLFSQANPISNHYGNISVYFSHFTMGKLAEFPCDFEVFNAHYLCSRMRQKHAVFSYTYILCTTIIISNFYGSAYFL